MHCLRRQIRNFRRWHFSKQKSPSEMPYRYEKCIITLYQIFQTLGNHRRVGFLEHWRKKEKILLSSISSFPQYFYPINSLPNDNVLEWPNFKAFADGHKHVTQILTFVLEKVESNVKKRRKCWLPAFSPFPTMFSKAVFLMVIKCR